jgi:hypothetical protein
MAWNTYAGLLALSLSVDGWNPITVRRLGLEIYDGAHCLGATWELEQWRAKFHPTASGVASKRKWARLKAELRHAGVRFDLLGAWREPWALRFASREYLRAVAEALCPIEREFHDRGAAPDQEQVLRDIAALRAHRTGTGR